MHRMSRTELNVKWNCWANEEDGIKIAKLIRADYFERSLVDGRPVLLIKNMTHLKYYLQWLKITFLMTTKSNLSHVGLMHDHFSSTSNFLNNGVYIKIDGFNIDIFKHNLREEKLKRILNEK